MSVGKPASKTPGRPSLRRLRVGVVAMVAQGLSVSRRIIDGSSFGARYIAACFLQVMVRLGFRQRCCRIVSRWLSASPGTGARA